MHLSTKCDTALSASGVEPATQLKKNLKYTNCFQVNLHSIYTFRITVITTMATNSSVHSSVASFLSSWWHYKSPDTNGTTDDGHFCKSILYSEIPETRVRWWDALIFLPNFIFLLFLLYRFKTKTSRERIHQLNSFPILRNFYIFIYLCVLMSILRCFISVVMKVHTTGGDLIDKVKLIIYMLF